MTKAASRIVESRHNTQQVIKDKYGPEYLAQAEAEFCTVCRNHFEAGCRVDVIPLTLSGDRCPYFTPPPNAA